MSKTISPNNTKNYPEKIINNVSEVDNSSIIVWYDTKFDIWVANVVDIYEDGSVDNYSCCSAGTEEGAIDKAISMFWEMRDFYYNE